jgi:hypothetical protein
MGFLSDDKTLSRIAKALEKLVELYELDLQTRGVTTSTDLGEGECYETDEAFLFEQEQIENVRKQLGLSPSYPVGAALPTPGLTSDSPKAREAEEIPGSPLEAFSGSSWGTGPEGAESP